LDATTAIISEKMLDQLLPDAEAGDRYPTIHCKEPNDVLHPDGIKLYGIPPATLAEWCEVARREGNLIDRREQRRGMTPERAKALAARRWEPKKN
jgi:hypothetical protein